MSWPGWPPLLRRAEERFEHLLTATRVLLGTLMLLSIAINFANVVARYLFAEAIIWAEETMIYIMVWLVFGGVVLVGWDNRHLKMDLVSASLAERPRKFLNAFSVALLLAACLFVLVNSVQVVALMVKSGQVSVAAEIPMAVPHAAILVGFALMLVAVLLRLRSHLAGVTTLEIESLDGDDGAPAEEQGAPDRDPG